VSVILKPIEIVNKGELVSLVSSQLKEEPTHFQILDRDVGTRESGFADLVAVDLKFRLTLFYFLTPLKESIQIAQTLSNYHWACENFLNIKKMYPQAEINTGEMPQVVYLAPLFAHPIKKVLSLLRLDVSAFQYQSFQVNGIPCLHLEKVGIQVGEAPLMDLQVEKLKSEYSGRKGLSNEEILEFLNFEREQRFE